jgi:hypothetical protein
MSVRDALLISNLAFLVLTALAFVAGAVSLFLSGLNERGKDRELAAYHASTELRIHSARADIVAALERVLASERRNLEAKERTAMIVRDAAALHAQAMADRARAVEAPPAAPRLSHAATERTLSSIQRAKMISVLIEHPGQITVVSGGGPEAERYAEDLRVIFSVSRWRVEGGSVADFRLMRAPLSLALGTSEQDIVVRTAFEAAGVAVANRPRGPMDPPTTIYVGPT